MTDTSFLEIKVISGSVFGLKRVSSDEAELPSLLFLQLPDNAQIYTIRDLVKELSSAHGLLKKLILDEKTSKIKGNTLIIINGTHMDLLGGLDTPVKVGDNLILTPFLAGG
jgi:molybdopterin converting factor small subunit